MVPPGRLAGAVLIATTLGLVGGCPSTEDLCHDARERELVNPDPLSCGPALVTCADAGLPQVSFPSGLPQELIDETIEDARERLDNFANPARLGTAFYGDYWVSESSGTTQEARGEYAELYGEPPAVMLRFSSGFFLDFGTLVPGSIIPDDQRFRCPESTPWPRPGEPYSLGPTTCHARDGTRGPLTFTVDVRPLVPQDLVWEDLVGLSEDPYLSRASASNRALDYSGTSALAVDSTTYRDGPQSSRTFVDYQAIWRLDTDDLDTYCVERVDIVHAESCSFPEDVHWHGRYDVRCREIGTLDGRPYWGAPF